MAQTEAEKKAYFAAYYAANRDKRIAYAKKYKNDPELAEKRRAAKRAYYDRLKNDPDRLAKRQESHREAHAARLENPDYKAAYQEKTRLKSSAWYEANRDAVLARYDPAKSKAEREKSRFRYYAHGAKRRALRRQATPPWADIAKIASVYEDCARITAETGIRHEVDHIIPLKGKFVTGLHVHNNLQVITRDDNRRKSARFDVWQQ